MIVEQGEACPDLAGLVQQVEQRSLPFDKPERGTDLSVLADQSQQRPPPVAEPALEPNLPVLVAHLDRRLASPLQPDVGDGRAGGAKELQAGASFGGADKQCGADLLGPVKEPNARFVGLNAHLDTNGPVRIEEPKKWVSLLGEAA